MRFERDTGREGPGLQKYKDLPEGPDKLLRYLRYFGPWFFGVCRAMLGWLDQPEVFPVRFETLCGDAGEAAQLELVRTLVDFLEIPGCPREPRGLLRELIGRPTLTWSGQRSERAPYWNDEVEEFFRSFGGHLMNARLGYE
jgi:hypothetical protein